MTQDDLFEEPRHTGSAGNSLLWWLLGFFTMICTVGAGAWATGVAGRQANIEAREQILENRLEQIDGKLDVLLRLQTATTTPRSSDAIH